MFTLKNKCTLIIAALITTIAKIFESIKMANTGTFYTYRMEYNRVVKNDEICNLLQHRVYDIISGGRHIKCRKSEK